MVAGFPGGPTGQTRRAVHGALPLFRPRPALGPMHGERKVEWSVPDGTSTSDVQLGEDDR